MPATAGRVRMPANNRVHSSAALQTHGIWQSAIGYDPYAPTKDKEDHAASHGKVPNASVSEPEGGNAYTSFKDLMNKARVTNSNTWDEARGACNKCRRVGHLTYQCRNFLSVKDREGIDDEILREVVLEKLKGDKVKKMSGESSDEDKEDDSSSESSDSEYDSEIERILAAKNGKKDKSRKRGRSRKGSKKRDYSDSEDEYEEKRRKRDYSDSEDEDEESERRRRRKSKKEKTRRRSHKHSSENSDYSSEASADRRPHCKRRSVSPDSERSRSDDSRIGRKKKRTEKSSRKHHTEKED